jgi:hypothetical protein
MHELETDNVFMSLVQDFGKKSLNEPRIAVGTTLRAYTHPRNGQPPLKRPLLKTQFTVVLKEIGADTCECLKYNLQDAEDSTSNRLQERSRMYLKELISASVDYADEKEKEKWAVVMQNIPLVYSDSMLGSENWVRYRSALADRWRAEQGAHGGAVEHRQTPSVVAEDE